MPRTRDLILFIACALFLLGAILFTVSRSVHQQPLVNFSDDVISSVEVVPTSDESLDRPSTIARLREKIGSMLVLEDAKPSVVNEPEPTATSTDDTDAESEAEVAVLRCAGAVDGLATAGKWPREGVVVMEAEGMRTVSHQDASGMVTPLLTLPLYAGHSGSPSCLDSEIIGVTLHGSLIFNTDAITYDTTGQNVLIGYARDGVPIYGQYDGTTDVCGGYDPGTGYRYGLSRDRNFMIGCFAANPAHFSI